MSMDKNVVIAFLSLMFMLFVQASAGIWWASKLTAVQAQHTEWIMITEKQQKDYPVLVNRVAQMENQMDRLIIKLDALIDKLMEDRRTYEVRSPGSQFETQR